MVNGYWLLFIFSFFISWIFLDCYRIEEQTRLSMIKEQIHQTIFRNGSQDELPMKDDKHSDSRSSEDDDQTTHDIAFPAVCMFN